MYRDIKDAITNNITSLPGIKNVYGYEKGNLDGYPSAVITCQSIESTYETNVQNTRKYTFMVKIFQEMVDDAAGAETAEGIIEAFIDLIYEKFENDYTLSGNCYKVDIKGIVAYVDRGTKMRVIQATLDCYTLITLT